MNKSEARYISEKHKFTKKECYLILKEALESKPDSFWKKPSSNKQIDLGAYFNMCVRWVGYIEGENNDKVVSNMVAFRVLHFFGEYSKIQPHNKSPKPKIEIKLSEKPKLA